MSFIILILYSLLTACNKPLDPRIADSLYSGNYARARVAMQQQITADRSDRDYVLDRMRTALLTMADGYPHAANLTFEQLYDTLRIQGLNADRTTASVVINEGVKIWKGEPFEQALAFTYYAMQQASLDSWDNSRAALDNALFYLRDFGTDDEGNLLNKTDIANRASGPDAQDDYLDAGYIVDASNFTLGYLLSGIANLQLARPEEGNENLAFAQKLVPQLEATVNTLRNDDYNTILVVSWGLGPQKRAEGLDGALAVFRPRTASDNAPLEVQLNNNTIGTFPVVTDVNQMAADHRWNNLEDVRTFKAIAGTGLVIGGLAATKAGIDNDNQTLVLAGLIAAGSGALLKASAKADIRYCEATPQRFYLVPLKLAGTGDDRIQLQIAGKPGSRLVLAGLSPPTRPQAQLRYVRMPTSPGVEQRPWATSGQVCYHTDHAQPTLPLTGDNALPLPLGGRDARTPDDQMLNDLVQANLIPNLTWGTLLDLYRTQNIKLTVQDQYGQTGLHVLEGGKSLVSPLPGTTGFTRLFGQIHPSFKGNKPEPQTQ
ncbi:MAG: hypothetical protein RLN76_04590 [Phycisphaeraceae bacterium]